METSEYIDMDSPMNDNDNHQDDEIMVEDILQNNTT